MPETVDPQPRTRSPALFALPQLGESARLARNLWLFGVLAVIIVVPAGRFHVLGPMLGLSVVLGAITMPGDMRLGRFDSLRLLTLGFAGVALVPVVIGVLRSNPGWRDVGIALIAGPVAWFFIGNLADRWLVERLPTAISVGTVVVTAAMFMLLSGFGRDFVRAITPFAFGSLASGTARVSFSGTSSLIATVPFLATVVWDSFRYRLQLRHRPLLLVGFGLGLMAVLISGRQGVIGAVALTPMLIWLTGRVGFAQLGTPNPRNMRQAMTLMVAGVSVAIAVVMLLGLNPLRLPQDLLASVGVMENRGNIRIERTTGVRSAQAQSLLREWGERPLIGHGAGAVTEDFFTWRGYEIGTEFTDTPRPWRAELSYHLLLFEAGLLGIALYLGAVVIAFRQLRRRFVSVPDATARMMARAAIVASVALAISTAANPLARTIGLQWAFVLPVIVLAGWSRRS